VETVSFDIGVRTAPADGYRAFRSVGEAEDESVEWVIDRDLAERGDGLTSGTGARLHFDGGECLADDGGWVGVGWRVRVWVRGEE